jgi:5-methylcytosine-specific restriction endonuclease McrA
MSKRLARPRLVRRWALSVLVQRGILLTASGWQKKDSDIAALLGLNPPTKRAMDEAYLARDKKEKLPLAPSNLKRHSSAGKREAVYVGRDPFLQSYEWRKLRMEALKLHGARCQCCGASAKTGSQIHVDHIKPRRLFPELSLSLENLQVLCGACNHGKGNWDQTDWRSEISEEEEQRQTAFLREVIDKAAQP